MSMMQSMVRVSITSADVTGFLLAVNDASLPAYRVSLKDDLTVCMVVHRKDYPVLKALAQKKGADIQLLKMQGVYWELKRLMKRPALIIGMLLIFLLACFLPSRVLFVDVEGNTSIPETLIIEKASDCGIYFGASRRTVRSERVKNNLLAELPQLQWVGVNTKGCTATISIKERTAVTSDEEEIGVCSIVAVRDGIVSSCTVTKGNARCKPGQAVRAGEVLVSGYTDCGISIQATRAEAEIFAQTLHDITAVMPINYAQKGYAVTTYSKYSIIIGKKRINFGKDSGISDTTCDKMYNEYYLTLPGGFKLPIALAITQCTVYNYDIIPTTADAAQAAMSEFIKQYLLEQMISGQIQSRTEHVDSTQDVCRIYGQYTCLEMIGRAVDEEILKYNGKND